MRASLGLGAGFDASALGQDERKYNTTNPVVRRLIARLCDTVTDRLSTTSGTIADIGSGEGLALRRVLSGLKSPHRQALAVEYRFDKLARAADRNPTVGATVGDIGALPFADHSIPVVLCMEVLEHLDKPQRAAAELARVTGNALIVTVPYEPYFRLGNLARGKNIRHFGNDAEHIQQFNRASLASLLNPYFETVAVATCFPWLVATCTRPQEPG